MLRGSWTAFCYWALCFWPFLVVGVGAECTWDTTNKRTEGNGEQWGVTGTTLPQCQSGCTTEKPGNCAGVQYYQGDGTPCTIFTTEPVLIEKGILQNIDYYRYSCTTASCTMQVVPDKHVTSSTSTSVEMEASADACKTLCKSVSQCQAITYHTSTSICIIHASATTESTVDHYMFSRKIDCDDEKACCFDTDLPNKRGESSSSVSLDLNDNMRLQSCKDMCEATTSCTAVTFVNNRCSIYNATSFQTETQSGSSYYSNSCTGGSLTIVYTCSSSSQTVQLSKLLGVWLVAVYTALL